MRSKLSIRKPGADWTSDVIESVRRTVWYFARWQKTVYCHRYQTQPTELLGNVKEAFESPVQDV